MADPLVSPATRNAKRLALILVLGFLLGGLLTELSVLFLPDSAPRDFFTTSVVASLQPSTVDVIGVTVTLGLGLTINFLTLVGTAAVAFVTRSLL